MDNTPTTLAEALAEIKMLEQTVWLMKRQLADETSEKYAAYARIVELRRELDNIVTVTNC
jgi:hypothetical protein